MKKIHLFSLLLFSLFLCSFHSPQKMVFKGRILFTSEVCTGKKSSDEDILAASKSRAFANQNLYIKRLEEGNLAEKPVVAQVKTDKNGYFSVTLDKGKYGILTERKMNLPDEYNMPGYISKEDCLKWGNIFDLKFTISKPSTTAFTFHYHQECSPCKAQI